MDVGLALVAVAQDREAGGIGEEAADEVIADSVRLAGADDVAEPEHAPRQSEHVAVRRDERLSGELAGAVGRDRHEGAVAHDAEEVVGGELHRERSCNCHDHHSGHMAPLKIATKVLSVLLQQLAHMLRRQQGARHRTAP